MTIFYHLFLPNTKNSGKTVKAARFSRILPVINQLNAGRTALHLLADIQAVSYTHLVSAPMPGKVVAFKAAVGQALKKGDLILVLEAMKMENDIVAPQDGTIASINASTGDSVESGAVLATLN